MGFVHMASSFKDTFEMPCEYKFGRDLPLKFQARAAAAVKGLPRGRSSASGGEADDNHRRERVDGHGD